MAAQAQSYSNFESGHVHPVTLTPSGERLLVVNTPDAVLEIFALDEGGVPTLIGSAPVGLEPVSVVARSDSEAWVANHLSDAVSIVDLDLGITTRTLFVGDEPTDIAFANDRAFVAVAQEDVVKVYALADLDAPPAVVGLFSRDIRSLAVSSDGQTVYAVPMISGNQTTVLSAQVIFQNQSNLKPDSLHALGLNDMVCAGEPPAYPPLPSGIVRNPALTSPADGVPRVGLIVRFDPESAEWVDEAGQLWTHCLPFRLPDRDLFLIDASTLSVTTPLEGLSLGTSLFDVSVNPADGRLYVPHTEARNFTRFAHPLGLTGRVVDNRLAVVDLVQKTKTIVDLNGHIDPASEPPLNIAERQASISQPGMMAWASDGSAAYLTAIGSRKVFRIDPGCMEAACIFGADRAVPDAVETGEGPTGVALLERANRLYVVNRFSNSLAIVDTETMTKVDEVALHDPSATILRDFRRFLYDGIVSSRHGDASCASCHLFGDTDGLSWDLGAPSGDLAPYTTPFDNVRFVQPIRRVPPRPCSQLRDPRCAEQEGFDPQKGPMFTQTLRGMLEPLHWRGDMATIEHFNEAFVTLMGAEDIGSSSGGSGGLDAEDMEQLGKFLLAIELPPNPFRQLDDTLPDAEIEFPERGFSGNPVSGDFIFRRLLTSGNNSCNSCHAFPFGAAGGKLGGVEPTERTSLTVAGVINGMTRADFRSEHSDLKVAHLRQGYEKIGPLFGDSQSDPPDAKSGFGFGHDGAIPNLLTWLSSLDFQFDRPKDQRDVAAFLLHYPTNVKPAVGRAVTVPPGAAPTGSAADEDTLATLMAVGDIAGETRHCDLVAATLNEGRQRRYHWVAGQWKTDVAATPPVSTQALREQAQGPITFLCASVGSGPRLGGDRDNDGVLDGDDNCPSADNTGQEDDDGDGIGDACGLAPAPTITRLGPAAVRVETTTLILVRGSGFAPSATVSFLPDPQGNFVIDSTEFVSPLQLRITVTVAADAVRGSSWDARVVNPDGRSATLTGGFVVD